LALPFVAFLLIFNYVPLAGWIYAFFDYTPGLPLSQAPFVGLKYFVEMFKEWDQTGIVIRNTLALGGLNILFTPLPMIFAILLNEITNKHFKKLIQTTTTVPNFISWIIVYGLTYAFFSIGGMVNTIFVNLGIFSQPQNFLGNPDIAWFFQTALMIWKGLGWQSIIYLAAISGIDQELYEAAKVDGANRWKRILHVTLPGVASTYFVLLLLGISNILSNGFDQYYVFNNALVNDKLMVLDLYIYNMGIIFGQYSYSVAIGIWKTVIAISLLLFANRLSRKVRGESIF
jgi:ABC-type polysaccharide transport system permease subunit